MGGSGSGRWLGWNSKVTTESQQHIDIRWLKKEGYLFPGNIGMLSWTCRGKTSGSIRFKIEVDRIVLNYRHLVNDNGWEDVEQVVFFDQTPCNYGGYRLWFHCPDCWRRVAIIYGVQKYFLCRHCYNLIYASQQENKPDRLIRKAMKIRQKLGGGESLQGLFPDKPKNMHWITYGNLLHEAEKAEMLGRLIVGQ